MHTKNMAKTNVVQFFRGVRQEAAKVTWPTRKETMISTGMVLVMVVLAALFFLVVDEVIAIGVLLRGTKREDVERGQVLAKPGTITPHTKFTCEAYILTKEEGGRHTPFFTKYRPQFYFRTTDVTGTVELPEGTEMVMPGDNLKFNVELIAPIAMEDGLRFAIREGGRTVGAGVVASIIE